MWVGVRKGWLYYLISWGRSGSVSLLVSNLLSSCLSLSSPRLTLFMILCGFQTCVCCFWNILMYFMLISNLPCSQECFWNTWFSCLCLRNAMVIVSVHHSRFNPGFALDRQVFCWPRHSQPPSRIDLKTLSPSSVPFACVYASSRISYRWNPVSFWIWRNVSQLVCAHWMLRAPFRAQRLGF